MNQFGLRLRGLSKTFSANGRDSVRALVGLDLDLSAGEFVVIVGGNGSGKSTLLNLVAGVYLADEGSITLVGPNSEVDWTTRPRWERAAFVARVHQNPQVGTVADLTVAENLRLASMRDFAPSPLRIRPSERTRLEYEQRIEAAGLGVKLGGQVSELSQGQRQLLAIELALLRHPAFLLLDEHTASLDRTNAQRCMDATAQLCRTRQATVMMVTHNLHDALAYGDRLIVLRDGRLAANLADDEKRQVNMVRLMELCGFMNGVVPSPTNGRSHGP